MNLNRPGIYEIVNVENGKKYIGSAVNLRHRRKYHWMSLRNNDRSRTSTKLQNAWNKYGEENFRFNVIEFVDGIDNLIKREQYWLDYHKTYERGIGYNTASVAGSNYGCKYTEEGRRNISLAKMGEKNPNYRGRSMTAETRMLISKANKGRSVSDETRLKISMAAMGNTYSQGERNHAAVLTESDVWLICWLLTNPDIRQRDIAQRFGVSLRTISVIASGSTWKHLNAANGVMEIRGKTKTGTRSHFAKINETQLHEIRGKIQSGESNKSIAAQYGVHPDTIRRIKVGQTHFE